MKRFGWKQWTVLAAFILAVTLTGLFAVRATRHAVYWRYHHDEPIRAWMSVRYISHSYHVPPQVLYEAIGLPTRAHDRRPLREIAREQHKPVGLLITGLQGAIVQARSSNSSPSSPPAHEGGQPR